MCHPERQISFHYGEDQYRVVDISILESHAGLNRFSISWVQRAIGKTGTVTIPDPWRAMAA